ncbi:MAG: hypothetical protein HYY77_22035, partial [Betaproteobacteria bacterium]|nr:hypothetical protein [Betaproteobacteria bacterium]
RVLLTPHGLRLCSPVKYGELSERGGSGEYFVGDRENGGVFKHANMMATTALFKAAKEVEDQYLAAELAELAYSVVDKVLPFRTLGDPYVLRGNPATKRIPPAVAGKVGQLLREYQYGEHLVPGHTSNYHLASRLGITDYLLDRFAIAGTPEDCRGKIAALREAGVRNLCFSFSGGPDPARYVQRFGEEVLPAFAS